MSAVETRRGNDVSLSDDQSWQSRFEGLEMGSSGSERLSDVDLERGVSETKVRSGGGGKVEAERDCRICQLGLECERTECGVPIQLGCSCKGDLGSAHKQCAETWFKIKGDTRCEICGATALNVAGNERTSEANVETITAQPAPVILVETIWHGRRIMNFLLACMVFAFVTSWLFHFKIL